MSAQRVRELLRSGELPGHRIGARQWVVDDAAYSVHRPLGQPMSPSMAWALIASLGGDARHPDVPAVRVDRLREYRERLLDADEEAPELISSWLRN